jgi:hypothetical protein
LQRVVQLLQRFPVHLCDPHVLSSGALRALSSLECDGLSFTNIGKTSFTARGAVEEVLVPLTC